MIRHKIIYLFIAIVILLTALIYIISNKILTERFSEIEHSLVVQDSVRMHNALQNYGNSLKVKTTDWSQWDDTYTFIKDSNHSYITSNISDTTLETLEISLIAYINPKNEYTFLKYENDAEGIKQDILNNTFIKSAVNTDTHIHGLIETSSKLLYVEGQPILPTSGEGPVAGTLIFARFLDTDLISRFSELTQKNISIYLYGSKTLPRDVEVAKESLTQSNEEYFVQPLSEEIVAGYFVLDDVAGSPVGIIKVVSSREIYAQGNKTINTFTILSGTIVLLFGLLTLFILERLLLQRIFKLSQDVSKISSENLATIPIDKGSNDEIGIVITKINTVLTKLAYARMKELESHRLQDEAGEELKKNMEQVERLNKLMVDRELKMIEQKKEIERLRSEQK